MRFAFRWRTAVGWSFFSTFVSNITFGNETIPKFTPSFQPKGEQYMKTQNLLGSFTDSRDNKKYGTIKICTQTWMSEKV